MIGGAAVAESVLLPFRMRTRDIDIVLQSEDALNAFEANFAAWQIKWRRKGRNTFKECRFVDGEAFPPVVDVFTTDAEIGARVFTIHRSENVLPEVQGQAFVPSLAVLLGLKLRALQQRFGPDSEDKQAKDLLDLYHLVFHNQQGLTPLELLDAVPPADRRAAGVLLVAARRPRVEFAEQYAAIGDWLRRPP